VAVKTLLDTIVGFVARKAHAASGVAAAAITAHADRPRPSVNRALARLVEAGRLERLGAGRAVTYRIAASTPPVTTAAIVSERAIAAHPP
jgi:DNA-binding IclR family transcriptional regulator